jgi:hypothetical protein
MATKATEYDRKSLRDFYFKPIEGHNDQWECKKCNATKKQDCNRGYENLKSHARVCFGEEYLENFLKSESRGNTTLDSFFKMANKREQDIYKWIEWVVMSYEKYPISRSGQRPNKGRHEVDTGVFQVFAQVYTTAF